MKRFAAALLFLAVVEGFALGRPLATTPLLARRTPQVIKQGTPWYVRPVPPMVILRERARGEGGDFTVH